MRVLLAHGIGGTPRPGALTRAVRVRAHGFSASARQAIEDAGGTVDVLPLPFGDRRAMKVYGQFERGVYDALKSA